MSVAVVVKEPNICAICLQELGDSFVWKPIEQASGVEKSDSNLVFAHKKKNGERGYETRHYLHLNCFVGYANHASPPILCPSCRADLTPAQTSKNKSCCQQLLTCARVTSAALFMLSSLTFALTIGYKNRMALYSGVSIVPSLFPLFHWVSTRSEPTSRRCLNSKALALLVGVIAWAAICIVMRAASDPDRHR